MYSEWVDACKASVLQSSEWKRVSTELHTILSEKLSRDRVGFFADLSSREQLSYIKQIRRYELNDTEIYSNFRDKLEELIERYISIEVDKVEQSNNPALQRLSRLDRILQITSEGTAKLLHNFPVKEINVELSGLANMSISPNLRKEIWNLLLFNNDDHHSIIGGASDESTVDSARSSSGTMSIEVSSMRGSASSINTFRITEKCENILLRLSQTVEVPDANPVDSAPGFGDLNTLLPLMKGVMIEYHREIGFFNSEQAEQSPLCDERYFHFAVPVLVAITDFLSESITTKIQKYPVFQKKATKWFKRLIGGQSDGIDDENTTDALKLDVIQFGNDLYNRYFLELRDLILNRSPNLLDVLQRVAVAERLVIDQEDDGNTDDEQFEWIRVVVEPIMSEMIEFWFVTTVNIEMALHLWDQLLLKRFETLPLIICALLNVISVHLRDCHNVDGFTTVATRFLPTVHHTQWMQEMQRLKYFKSPTNTNMLERTRTRPQHEDDGNESSRSLDRKDSRHFTLDSTVEMLQPLPLGAMLDADPTLKISMQSKKLMAGMLMVGKLQRIRESLSQTQSISQSPMKTPRVLVDQQEKVVDADVKDTLGDLDEEEDDDDDDVVDDLDEETNGKGQQVMQLVIEEAVVQVLRGIRDIAALEPE